MTNRRDDEAPVVPLMLLQWLPIWRGAGPIPAPAMHSTALARLILTHLGCSTEPSLEPGADMRRVKPGSAVSMSGCRHTMCRACTSASALGRAAPCQLRQPQPRAGLDGHDQLCRAGGPGWRKAIPHSKG